jgi:hypothetical protein
MDAWWGGDLGAHSPLSCPEDNLRGQGTHSEGVFASFHILIKGTEKDFTERERLL